MRRIDLIVIHCAATTPDMDIGADTIDSWHRQRGFAGIGYHYVIRRSGVVENGRPIQTAGAHAQGHNAHSLGICLAGGVRKDTLTGKLVAEANYSESQWAALRTLVEQLMRSFPDAKVIGHRDLDQRKECPSFDVRDWLVAQGLHRGIEWDSGAQPAPPKPLPLTKTALGTVTTAATGLAAVADIGQDSPEQVAQIAQTALLGVPAGTWISMALGAIIVIASGIALYGRWDARRRSGV
jgi:hypothetical protein